MSLSLDSLSISVKSVFLLPLVYMSPEESSHESVGNKNMRTVHEMMEDGTADALVRHFIKVRETDPRCLRQGFERRLRILLEFSGRDPQKSLAEANLLMEAWNNRALERLAEQRINGAMTAIHENGQPKPQKAQPTPACSNVIPVRSVLNSEIPEIFRVAEAQKDLDALEGVYITARAELQIYLARPTEEPENEEYRRLSSAADEAEKALAEARQKLAQ